jgi:two-component system phosphate regulon sensor histidine kinase PhoR
LKRRLFWQLFPSYLTIVLISLIISTWYATKELKHLYINQVESDLKVRAVLVENQIGYFSPDNVRDIDKLCKELDQKVSMRITVLLPTGKVLGDSEENPVLMDNHKDRPEIIAALTGNIGNSIRYSHTLQKNMMYVAVPVKENNKVIGVVRTAIPLLYVDKVLKVIYFKIMIEGLIAALIATFISFFMSKRISKPLEELEEGVEKFTKGDLKYRLTVPNARETSGLAIAMNEMAEQLDNRLTQIKKLEKIRQDFIANVSHELKTPITSIKGYSETLIDGAIEVKEDARKFVGIILNQADRLNSIIEDLLSLSRLDQESQYDQLAVENSSIKDILISAMQLCTIKAESKAIKLEIFCPDDIQVLVSPSLIEQAVVNLIDNAVKYSSPDSKVLIQGMKENNEAVIKVIDFGCGIPEEHLSRIFERFYRVDKARSRKLGGTGLGLAIVKHISQIHKGYTSVYSTVGAGSVFSIHLPVNKTQIN